MKAVLKISGWLVFYLGLLAAILVCLVLYWSYGEKKKIPPKIVTKIERVFENISPGSKMFVGDAEVELLSFSKGFVINLSNSYLEFSDDDVVVSVPKIKLKLKPSDLLLGNLRFREVDLKSPKFVITGDVAQQDIEGSVSQDFLELYTSIIYSMFDRINKDNNSIPVDKIDLSKASFSFNKAGKYETWKVEKANLSFFSLQNTTYLSTFVKTELFKRKSEITINARLLEENRMMLKIEYKNLASQAISKFVKGLDWFDALQPVLNGTSSVVMDKEGVSSTISLDTEINYEKPELTDAKIGFKGVLDLMQNEAKEIKPKVHGDVYLKDVNMAKLPLLWPEKYGTKIREDVLKNYTKGTFNNVQIDFEYMFANTDFSIIDSEKFAISGNIINTDVIYNPEFPAIKKADGKFLYDGNNVYIDLDKGNLENLEFGTSKISVAGLNDEKTTLEIDGVAKGDITNLKPLLQSILKGRDKEFFYNTHEIKADSDIKFYYKDNIKNGFDPAIVKMDIEADLKNVEIKNVIEGVDLTSPQLKMKVSEGGLSIDGEVDLNQSPSQVEFYVGFVKENDLSFKIISEAQTPVLDKLFPGIAKFADGVLELEFEYKSGAEKNHFVGKIDSIDAAINFPYFAWQKPKGTFSTVTFGGQYMPNSAIVISELQFVSSDSVSVGSVIVSLNNNVADEISLNSLRIGGNNAEIYFNRDRQKPKPAYIIKINGEAFNAAKLIDSFQKLAGESSSMIFDLNVKNLLMANNITLKNAIASLKCDEIHCYKGSFNADIQEGGKVTANIQPKDAANANSIKTFSVNSDNAGNILKSFGFSKNVEGGSLDISGNIGQEVAGETKGLIQMRDFKITNAPVLSRLFSLASLTGILDVLTGSGVPMKKLKGTFKIKDDYLSVTELRSFGDSLGFTLQGNIDLSDSDVDLSGAVTPSYSINSMFGKIPVLGAVFKGKEGEGLIATSYQIKGKYPDVEISVNPLSALTPGFLRNIWGEAETNIDKKKAKKSKNNVKQKGFPVNTNVPVPAN